MPLPALLLVLATLLPLAAFVLLLLIGKRMGDPLAGWAATAFAAGSFALSMAGMIAWYEGGQLAGMTWGPGDKPIELVYKWLPAGAAVSADHPGVFDLNLHVDTLTVAMFNTITLVAVLGLAFSARFMRDDKRFARFFVYLQLSFFSMLAFVLCANLLEIVLFWFLLGLSAYLVEIERDDPPNRGAAILSFIVKRIGDAGFLLGIGLLFHFFGNATLLQLDRWLWPATDSLIHLPDGAWISGKTLSIVGIALFCGAACRSALFPLHFWLPVSRTALPAAAFVQSVTLAAAGLYLIARIFPMLTPTAKLFIGVVGLVSLVVGGLFALFQNDLGRILAFSTVSQFGLMFMAIGIGSWVGGLFHLLTHAFFKSLLILAAASVVHAANGERKLQQFGGLIRKMPLAGVTFAIGLLAMAGAPFTSGHYSYETILIYAGALASSEAVNRPMYWAFFVIPAVISGVTALYMTRCWMLLFWGTPRNRLLHVTARERTGFWFPLFGLAVVSLIGGSRLLDMKQFIVQSGVETDNYCDAARDPAGPQFVAFTGSVQQGSSAQDIGEGLFNRYASWPFGAGIVLGFVLYCRKRSIPVSV